MSAPGKEIAGLSTRPATSSILAFAESIRGADPALKATVVFQTAFSTIARHFGLGTTAVSADTETWSVVRQELATMILAYLRDPS